MKRRKIDNRIIHRLALTCIADQIEAILDNSEHEISIIEDMGGTDSDYDALRRAMIRVGVSPSTIAAVGRLLRSMGGEMPISEGDGLFDENSAT